MRKALTALAVLAIFLVFSAQSLSPLAASPNPTTLPLGDNLYTNQPRAGYVYSCLTTPQPAPTVPTPPWIHGSAWDLTQKVSVPGSVKWNSTFNVQLQGSYRIITSNGLPNHPTGTFPIPTDSAIYRYDTNPSSIKKQKFVFVLPANPTVASQPHCVWFMVGVMKSGAADFMAFSLQIKDADAWEGLDSCGGQPEGTYNIYHYHGLTPCIDDPGTGHSNLLGYSLDGFGIYGPRGENGQLLSSSDLDECHGHTHVINWDGRNVTMYHYHLTEDFPYTVSCYKGVLHSSISAGPSSQAIQLGSSVKTTGVISPPPATPPNTGAQVTMTYSRIGGETVQTVVQANKSGTFSDTFTPQSSGNWSLKASWNGDPFYPGAESLVQSFVVSGPTTTATTTSSSSITTSTVTSLSTTSTTSSIPTSTVTSSSTALTTTSTSTQSASSSAISTTSTSSSGSASSFSTPTTSTVSTQSSTAPAGGSGAGVPEFPGQPIAATVLVLVVVLSYLAVKRPKPYWTLHSQQS